MSKASCEYYGGVICYIDGSAVVLILLLVVGVVSSISQGGKFLMVSLPSPHGGRQCSGQERCKITFNLKQKERQISTLVNDLLRPKSICPLTMGVTLLFIGSNRLQMLSIYIIRYCLKDSLTNNNQNIP